MLKPVVKGLRPIHNRSNDVAKTSLVVPAGDTLIVSDAVAAQLLGAQVGFAEGEGPPPDERTDAEREADEEAEAARAAKAEAKAAKAEAAKSAKKS